MPAHGIPHNSNTKCLPSPPPASLRLELPKRKAQEQPCIHVPVASAGLAPSQGSPTAVFKAHHPLPSSWGGPWPSQKVPQGTQEPPCLWLGPLQHRHGQGPRHTEVAGSQGACPPLLRGESSAASPENHMQVWEIRLFTWGALEGETQRLWSEVSSLWQRGNSQ